MLIIQQCELSVGILWFLYKYSIGSLNSTCFFLEEVIHIVTLKTLYLDFFYALLTWIWVVYIDETQQSKDPLYSFTSNNKIFLTLHWYEKYLFNLLVDDKMKLLLIYIFLNNNNIINSIFLDLIQIN